MKKFIEDNPLFFAFFFPALMDGVVTLLGQDRSYWTSRIVDEASPAYYVLLVSPWLFAVGSILWFVFWYWVFKRLREPFNLLLMFLFIAGHSWGSSSWIMKMLKEAGIYAREDQLSIIFAWTLLIFYFLVIAGAATYCLGIYLTTKREGTTTKSKALVDKAKQLIDESFDKMGRSIEGASLLDRYLIAGTYKAVRFSDAIIVLCEQGLTDEALPILRSLIEHSINMRWITHKDSKNRLKEYFSDFSKDSFGVSWTNKTLDKRMEEVGFKGRDYYDYCVKLTYSHAHVNASSLKWGEVIDHPQLSKERWSPEAIYPVIAQMLGHVMKSLNSNFEGYFSDYNEIWNKVKVDKDIRSKVEKLRELLKQSDKD